MRLTQQTPKSIYPRTVNYWCICICLPTEKHLHVWLGQNKPCGFSDEDTQNSKNLYLCMRCVCLCVWNLEYRLCQRGEGCEQCIEVPLKKKQETSCIWKSEHAQKKNACIALHSPVMKMQPCSSRVVQDRRGFSRYSCYEKWMTVCNKHSSSWIIHGSCNGKIWHNEWQREPFTQQTSME